MKLKNPFVAFNKYCIRTPSLPIGFLEGVLETKNISSLLKKTLKNTFIREAIYLASPVLFSQMKLWEKDDVKDSKKKKRIENSLLKYLTRISSRCTPFGLFSGVAVGGVSAETKIEVADIYGHHRITRYDMHFLVSLAKNLSKLEHIKRQLKFYPNSTLYRLGNRYRYIEYTYENKKRVHSIESVIYTEYLENILNKSKKGILLKNLEDYLEDEGFEVSDSVDFVNELVENQILVSEFEPNVTGVDFLLVLKEKFSALNNCTEELEVLNTLKNYLSEISGCSGVNLLTYTSIKDYVSSSKIDVEPKYLLQTDLYPKFKANQLNSKILRKVKLGLWVLNKISQHQKNHHLEQFKSAFNKRWEHQKVPLLKVLDIESGIGYANSQVVATPFLDDIRLPIKKNSVQSEMSPFQEMLFEKLQQSKVEGKQVIELKIEDLNAFQENWENAPNTLSVMAEVVVQNKREKVVMDTAGVHAIRLLGRFATENNAMGKLVKEIALKEKELNADKILAEIIHVPESRTGNILRRPNIREHEIPCLGQSNLPQNQQIVLEDILVSVDYGEINLTHALSEKKVLPRLSNAHNYRNNPLPVYQFLCDLQYQEHDGYSFSWGSFMNEMAFLPRVIFKDVILSKARWKISSEQIKKLKEGVISNTNTIVDFDNKVEFWRNLFNIPNKVQLVEGDNKLLIDFSSSWSIKLLFENSKNKKSIVLQEVLEDENPIVKSGDSTFRNEFIFSFYNNRIEQLN